jgi:hypothetical protein
MPVSSALTALVMAPMPVVTSNGAPRRTVSITWMAAGAAITSQGPASCTPVQPVVAQAWYARNVAVIARFV